MKMISMMILMMIIQLMLASYTTTTLDAISRTNLLLCEVEADRLVEDRVDSVPFTGSFPGLGGLLALDERQSHKRV